MAATFDTRNFYVRISIVITICTVLLTASFVGILSFISGEFSGIDGRIPWYLVLTAGSFVATIVVLEGHGASGREIIATATIISIIVFVVIMLGVEGVLYTSRFPEEVFVSQLIVYFLAASLIGAGLGYWSLRHWREFTHHTRDGL